MRIRWEKITKCIYRRRQSLINICGYHYLTEVPLLLVRSGRKPGQEEKANWAGGVNIQNRCLLPASALVQAWMEIPPAAGMKRRVFQDGKINYSPRSCLQTEEVLGTEVE